MDPSMLSAVLGNPQSWNRYSYSLNNPLLYIDPNGELWIATGNEKNPYSWVDKCQTGQTCYTTVAAQVGDSLRVYGRLYDTFDLPSENGLVNVLNISQAGLENSNFVSNQTPGQEENYLGAAQAAALYNASVGYGEKYSNDSPLVFTAGSTGEGKSAIKPDGTPAHIGHKDGLEIDLKYVSKQGHAVANGQADVERMKYLIGQFRSAGMTKIYSGGQAKYGLGPISAAGEAGHTSHMHFGTPAPKREEPRIVPVRR